MFYPNFWDRPPGWGAHPVGGEYIVGPWLPWPPAKRDAQTVRSRPPMQRQAPDLRHMAGARQRAKLRPARAMPREKMLEECARMSGGPYSVSRSGAHLIARRAGAVRRSRLRPVVSDRWGSVARAPPTSGALTIRW